MNLNYLFSKKIVSQKPGEAITSNKESYCHNKLQLNVITVEKDTFKRQYILKMLEIINNQRKVKINLKVFSEFADIVIKQIAEANGKAATVAFVSDRKIRSLNKNFRGKNTATDVLSFPFAAEEFEADENTLGDIFISLEQAERQALENNLDFETEIKQLILHGILHLCGFDHETDAGEMNELELELREKFEI